MNLDTRYTMRFSRQEIVRALKAAHPKNIYVQAIPETVGANEAPPTLASGADYLTIAWTKPTRTTGE